MPRASSQVAWKNRSETLKARIAASSPLQTTILRPSPGPNACCSLVPPSCGRRRHTQPLCVIPPRQRRVKLRRYFLCQVRQYDQSPTSAPTLRTAQMAACSVIANAAVAYSATARKTSITKNRILPMPGDIDHSFPVSRPCSDWRDVGDRGVSVGLVCDSNQKLDRTKSHVIAPTTVHQATCWTRPQTTKSVAPITARTLNRNCLFHAFACSGDEVSKSRNISMRLPTPPRSHKAGGRARRAPRGTRS